MGVPSRRIEPKARPSAVAQSSGSEPSAIFARRASCWTILGFRLKPAGTVVRARPIGRASRGRRRSGLPRRGPVSPRVVGGGAGRPARRLLRRLERRLVRGELPGFELLDFRLGQDALAHEPPRVERAHARVLLDPLVHEGLGVGRLVPLVVAVAAEADQVDDDVLVELLAVVERDLQDAVGRLGVVAVDVEDRDLVDLRDVRRIERRAAFLRGRS